MGAAYEESFRHGSANEDVEFNDEQGSSKQIIETNFNCHVGLENFSTSKMTDLLLTKPKNKNKN